MSAVEEIQAAKGRSMGSHQSAAMITDRWLTPRHVLDAMGEFDLDPCGAPGWSTAKTVYTPETHGDGLTLQWHGRVWLNPPYGKQATIWMRRLADHGNGTALIFARTETRMFFETVWNRASAVLFLEGRLTFVRPDGTPAKANGGAPSVLIAYGESDALKLKHCSIPGQFIPLGMVA
ncbi:phage N-6-adenine-methyltransferase [Cryobacterium sp. Y57]|uniref:phage N-6-adenine-methyltransferase n=1 Tax=Cryobacterium sp. Y57 TaxID=2048287 RepID=UPI001E3C5CD1|nr:phage N-6-adenine-methyltransferase [Cryobacterium sp. Y57]